jgi:hypothetical protein
MVCLDRFRFESVEDRDNWIDVLWRSKVRRELSSAPVPFTDPSVMIACVPRIRDESTKNNHGSSCRHVLLERK